MEKDLTFDKQEAYKHFSTYYFNAAWDLLEKEGRTDAEDEEMLALVYTSLWHWMQREDCNHQNLSVGYWQLSHVHAVLDKAENADKYAHLCLSGSEQKGVAAVYLGYAYEALARAASIAGDEEMKKEYCKKAEEIAEGIHEKEEREQLLNDLATI